jgi:hypothetical protein
VNDLVNGAIFWLHVMMKQDPPSCHDGIVVTSSRGAIIVAIALAVTLAASDRGRAVVVATDGSYDPATGGNVDSSATIAPNEVATFTTAVLAASGAGFGGVIHFDLPANQAGSTLEATYAGGTKTLNILNNPGFNIQTTTSATVLSGRALLLTATDTGDDNATLTFGSITNGLALEAVTQVGFTVLSRNSTGYPQDITITAFFSDGSNSAVTSNIISGLGTDDTYFGFTAPTGFAITSILFNPTGDALDGRLVIDDFGFITSVVPEPSTAMLGCGALLVMMVRRKR